MSWSSGSGIMVDIIRALKTEIENDARKNVYLQLIPTFEANDCDTLDECLGEDIAFDLAYRESDVASSRYREFTEWFDENHEYDHELFQKYAKIWDKIWSVNKAYEDICNEMDEKVNNEKTA